MNDFKIQFIKKKAKKLKIVKVTDYAFSLIWKSSYFMKSYFKFMNNFRGIRTQQAT